MAFAPKTRYPFDFIASMRPLPISPVICVPAVSHAAHLDFEMKDAVEEFVTPEGALKQKMLSSISSATVTAAAGTLNQAYAFVGMAGVGKTTALQRLAGDKDVRARFPDGIQYISLGQGQQFNLSFKRLHEL